MLQLLPVTVSPNPNNILSLNKTVLLTRALHTIYKITLLYLIKFNGLTA